MHLCKHDGACRGQRYAQASCCDGEDCNAAFGYLLEPLHVLMPHVALSTAINTDVSQSCMLLLKMTLNPIKHRLMMCEDNEFDLSTIEQSV